MAITIVEAVFPTLDSSKVSHLDCPARVTSVLKVDNSVAITSKELDVGSLCTKSCVTGMSKWILTVPGMRWRKVPIMLLSEVALIDSIEAIVIVFPLTETVWI